VLAWWLLSIDLGQAFTSVPSSGRGERKRRAATTCRWAERRR
jgi:hypothetical protein